MQLHLQALHVVACRQHELVKRIGQREAHLLHAPPETVEVFQAGRESIVDAASVFAAD
jgi:hypothetical protein